MYPQITSYRYWSLYTTCWPDLYFMKGNLCREAGETRPRHTEPLLSLQTSPIPSGNCQRTQSRGRDTGKRFHECLPLPSLVAGCHIDRRHRKTFYPGPGRKQGAETSVKVPRKKPDLNSRELNTGDLGWVCSPLSENESLGNNLSQLYAPELDKRVMQTLSRSRGGVQDGSQSSWLCSPRATVFYWAPRAGPLFSDLSTPPGMVPLYWMPSLALQTPFLQELAMHAVSPP